MFRKIVTESIYSPALAARLGEYTKKLRNETAKRQIGLIFVLLAIIVQLFSTLLPPESANADNPEIFIDGGIQSVEDYLTYYDQNTTGVKDLLTSLGITRLDVETVIPTTLAAAPDMSSWYLQNTRNKRDTIHYFPASDGSVKTAYHRPLTRTNAPLQAFVGSSSEGWFAISKETGNLISKSPSSTKCDASPPALKPGQSTALNKDTECNNTLESSLSVTTVSSNNHVSEAVRASDSVMYTLTVQNTGATAATTPLRVNLEDILEYSQIIDQGGGQFDSETKTLSWPDTALAANKSLMRSFIVRLLPTIPAVAVGQYISSSYDCTLTARFENNFVNTPVSCPPVKHLEQVTNSLPHLSVTVNLLFATCLLLFSLFLFLRSKQLLAELYIIRHNHLGTL